MMPILDELSQLVAHPDAVKLPADMLARAAEILADQQIEIAERRASPKQRQFQKVFFDRADATGRRVDIVVALGANRSGKTHAAGRLCFAKYLRDHAKAGDWFWCVGQNLERSVGGQQRELWEALPRRMFSSQAWDEKIGFGMHRKVVLPASDGGTCLVEFRSADQDPSTFEQAKLTGVWVDERLPETIFNRLIPRIVDRNGFILYSDIPEQSWQLDRLVEAEPRAGVYVQMFSMHDNASNLPQGAIEQAAARMTADEQKLRIRGEFVLMEGLVYKEFADAIRTNAGGVETGHLLKPFPIPHHWPKFRAIDYGASAPTACLWLTVAPNEHVIAYREHYERGRSIADNARLILTASGDEAYRRNFIDPCAYNLQPGLTETIARQYENGGITPLSGWPRVNQMGEHSMVQKVKFRLENRSLFVFEPLVNLRREFRSWKYKVDREGRPLSSDAFDDTGPNHLLDCLKGFVATNQCQTMGRVEVYG